MTLSHGWPLKSSLTLLLLFRFSFSFDVSSSDKSARSWHHGSYNHIVVIDFLRLQVELEQRKIIQAHHWSRLMLHITVDSPAGSVCV